MKRILYIPFDHLHRNFGALKAADPKSDVIAFVESARMTAGRNWHKERLFFLISSARHFAASLEQEGFTVEYVKAATTIDGLETIKAKHKLSEIICAKPSSFRQFEALQKYGVSFVANDFFLTPRPLFNEWAGSQKSFLMESFYRANVFASEFWSKAVNQLVVLGTLIKRIACHHQKNMMDQNI